MDTTTDFTVDLMVRYIFDLAGHSPTELVDHWLKDYPAAWIRLAVIESLYQGRYKAVSVEQILAFWKRRGQARYHFNHEFERLVCGSFPQMAGQFEGNVNFSSPASEKAVILNNAHDQPDAVVAAVATEIQLINADASSATKFLGTVNINQGTRLLKSDNPCPIEQFIPDADYTSDFYTKLKAIAESPKNQEKRVTKDGE